jgi:hypothetical protein
LTLGVFIPLGSTFYFIKKQKEEKQMTPGAAGKAADAGVKHRKKSGTILC